MDINKILSPIQPLSRHVVDDTPVGIVVKYVGSEVSATITVSSSGDITFKHGALASEAVDSTIDSGTDDAGVIDVSDSSANTFGKIVDMINNSSNWEAYLKDGLRADNSNNSTGSLLLRTETTLTPNVTETSLFVDTSKMLNFSIRIGSRTRINGTEEHSAAELLRVISTNTFGSGTSLVQIYEVDELKKTETKILEQDGEATGVEQDFNLVKDGRGSIAVSRTGMHLLVRLLGSGFMTGKMTAIGAVARGA